MNKRLRRTLRGGVSFLLATATLWVVAAAAPLCSLNEAAHSASDGTLALALLRFERGDFLSGLSLPSALALNVTPLLAAARKSSAANSTTGSR